MTKYLVMYSLFGYLTEASSGPYDTAAEAMTEKMDIDRKYPNGNSRIQPIETDGCCEDCRSKVGL